MSRRLDLHHNHLAGRELVLLDAHGRKRLDVPVRADVAQGQQELLVDLKAGQLPPILHPDDEVTGPPGKVVGEGADGLAELVLVLDGGGQLQAVRFPGLNHRQDVFV